MLSSGEDVTEFGFLTKGSHSSAGGEVVGFSQIQQLWWDAICMYDLPKCPTGERIKGRCQFDEAENRILLVALKVLKYPVEREDLVCAPLTRSEATLI